MFGYELTFERPGYLAFLLILPLLWALAYRGYAGMSFPRWALALALRSIVVAAIVVSLAEVHVVRITDRVSTIYLVDRSLSIPSDRVADAVAYVNETMTDDRRRDLGDAAGVISFGRDAAVEVVPWDEAPLLPTQFVSDVDPQQTDLAAAMKLARSMFPQDAARRIVILSDGNETLGDAATVARTLAADGIGIDSVAIRRPQRPETSVTEIVAPADVRTGAPFEVRAMLHVSPHPDRPDEPVAGRLTIVRKSMGVERIVAAEQVTLEPGKQAIGIEQAIDEAGFYSYEARFFPDDPDLDGYRQNDVASGFVDVRGPGRALIIVDRSRPDEFDGLVQTLREEEIDVTVQPTDRLFESLAELQSYDVVLLANVPRTGGEDVDSLAFFTDAQMQALADNVEQMGCGLGMIGGPESFGAGGWIGTPVEKAMPIDFQIPNDQVLAVGALAIVIDSSGSMAGQKVQLCKAAAREAVSSLGDRDYVGVTSFDAVPHKVVPMQKAANRAKIERMIGDLGADGGTYMYPAMVQAFADLRKSPAAAKHMIVLTDGQTQQADYFGLTQEIAKQGITVTAVAVGSDADVGLLQGIALRGGGKFYRVNSPLAIPRIFLREARRVSKPLVFEDPRGFSPQLVEHHEALAGLEEPLPPLTGYVLTQPKSSPLVEFPIVSPAPSGEPRPIVATWRYGIGRSFAITTDTGQRWAQSWNEWEGRDKLLVQMIRWAMRPQDDARLAVTTEVEGDRVRLIVTALDESDGFVNSLSPSVAAVGPDGEIVTAKLRQEAPGRYSGEFEAPAPGSYVLAVSPSPGESPVRLGVDVAYSREFEVREDNLAVLRSLAATVPAGGAPGIAMDLPSEGLERRPEESPFRRGLRPAESSQEAWYVALALAAGLLAFDVANRRIDWRLGWIAQPLLRLREAMSRREGESSRTVAIERLSGMKATVRQGWEERRSASRFEPAAATVTTRTDDAGTQDTRPAVWAIPIEPLAPDDEPDANNSDRLRRAKRDATAPKNPKPSG